MALSERKKKILRAVVDGYIETAAPVSSKDIQQRCLSDCSSATIRNELSALESMGYLVQPHISSGRAPSSKAFRLYVDELMEAGPLSEEEIRLINGYFNHQMNSLEEMVSSVAKVITKITNYTSVVVKNHSNAEIIKVIKLLELPDNSALVVIVTDAEIYKDNFIDLPKVMDGKWIDNAVNLLNKLFGNKTLNEIKNTQNLQELIGEEFDLYREIYYKVLGIIIKMSRTAKNEVITEGTGKIFEHPEYSDIEKAKAFITTMEQKDKLAQLIHSEGQDISIKIGEECDLPEGCSVVTAPININDKTVGSASVIGPIRMNYKKVLSVLDHIGKILDNIITEGKEKEENEQT